MDWPPKERTAQIYGLLDAEGNYIYIGSTTNIRKRMSHHKYRKLAVTVQILDVVQVTERFVWECYYINLAWQCCEPLLNRNFMLESRRNDYPPFYRKWPQSYEFEKRLNKLHHKLWNERAATRCLCKDRKKPEIRTGRRKVDAMERNLEMALVASGPFPQDSQESAQQEDGVAGVAGPVDLSWERTGEGKG